MVCGILGRFGGSKLLRSISDTLVDKDAVVGTENLREGGAAAGAGGKDAVGLGSGAAAFATATGVMGMAHPGMSA